MNKNFLAALSAAEKARALMLESGMEQFFDQHFLTDERLLTGQETALIEKIDAVEYPGGSIFRSTETGQY